MSGGRSISCRASGCARTSVMPNLCTSRTARAAGTPSPSTPPPRCRPALCRARAETAARVGSLRLRFAFSAITSHLVLGDTSIREESGESVVIPESMRHMRRRLSGAACTFRFRDPSVAWAGCGSGPLPGRYPRRHPGSGHARPSGRRGTASAVRRFGRAPFPAHAPAACSDPPGLQWELRAFHAGPNSVHKKPARRDEAIDSGKPCNAVKD